MALDFAGDLVDVLPQPFRLRYSTKTGWRHHVPDFLAIGRGGSTRLIDVRPRDRLGEEDRVCFAAAAEAALSAGWRYALVTGWRDHVMNTLDTLSSQRRSLDDHLGLQAQLMDSVARGPLSFADMVAATTVPAMARAQALHLLWHRRLGIDLAQPLTDQLLVMAPARGGR